MIRVGHSAYHNLTLGASAIMAKPGKDAKRRPTGESYEMRVSVVSGERSTQFVVTSSGRDGILTSSQIGMEDQKKFGRSEIELLLQTYANLPASNDIPITCYRWKIDIVRVRAGRPEAVKASCFGAAFSTKPTFPHLAIRLPGRFDLVYRGGRLVPGNFERD